MWFKVDDKLHDHRKVRKAGKAAMGVWVLAGSWAMDNETDGFIPEDVLTRWGTPNDAARLVTAGMWDVARHRGESGWRFHDWSFFQPSAAVTAAKKAKEREAGIRGNHQRWHANKGITDPDCEYCYRVPDREPDGVSIGEGESGAIPPVPEPDPLQVSPDGETSRPLAIVVPNRPDVDRVCEHLATRIEANGAKKPAIGKRWKDAARLMLDNDGLTEDEIHHAIDWSQADEFWRSNILSMPKLREKYQTLRLQAQRQNRPHGKQAETDGIFERAAARIAARQTEPEFKELMP